MDLYSPQTRRYISSITHIGTISHYTIEQGKNTPISLPIKDEQEKIGSLFKKLDVTIALHQQLVEQQQKYKKAMLQKMFPQKGERVPKVRFNGFSGEWQESSLGDISKIKTGNRDVQEAVETGQYPFFIRSEEIKKIDNYSFDGEAILIPGEGRLGEIFHYINGKFAFHQRVYKISDFLGANGKYVFYYMQKNFKRHAMKYTVKATVDSLRLPMLTEFLIPIPSLEEQKKIGTFFKQLDDTIALHQKKLEDYQQLKKALLQRMFV